MSELLQGERVVAVARDLDGSSAPEIVDALRAGGINCLEITVEGPGGLDAIGSVAGTELVLGAGTVTTTEQAAAAQIAGATFLVSPHLDLELARWAADHDVPLVPGAFTPTEIHQAWGTGPPAVKLFPAAAGGPGYVRALLGPYPDIPLFPTGGVDATNIADYLAAGAVAVGVGGWLTGPDDMGEVARRAERLLSLLD